MLYPSKTHISGRLSVWQRLYRGIIVALLFVLINLSHSWAAPPDLSDAEEQAQRARQEAQEQRQQARQEAQERQQREQQKDIFLQAKPQTSENDTSLPDESPSFPIHTLRIEGQRIEHFPWAQAMLEPYAGRNIGKEGINIIVKRLTNAFIERGYITTRVMIPEQDLSIGILRLVVIPGVIRDIRFAVPPPVGSWSPAFPARPGDILNLRDLEQGLEQMKRVPSQDVDMKLVPGDKPGESDVIIAIQQQDSEKLILSVDDSGSAATGRIQFSQTISIDNLLGINDLCNISLNRDGDSASGERGTEGSSFFYSAPHGYWTYTLSQSRYQYYQTIAGLNAPYVSSGQSRTTEVRAERLITRDQTSKTSLKSKVSRKHSKSYLDDTEVEVQRKNTTAAELGLAHRQYFGKTVWDVDVAHRWGTPWFGAQDEADDLPSDTPTTRYHIWTCDSSITKPVKLGRRDARYTCSISAQGTCDTLYTTDQFSIGNRYTVRGFDGEQTLAAEQGFYIQNEVGMPIAPGHEIYTGIDYGQVGGPSAQYLLGKHLTGSVLGLRGSIKQVSYDVFAGWPLDKPDGFKTAHTTCGFQLTCQI